ncbi:restriction endonuclease subunit S [Acinetobacter sp. YH12080]|uniref:restriction endonuclease subunit S n=1 Tax=Acinetobacter sp. YH12080 TaxID=2601073 RepID=UPI0015D15DA6|nr:restriction endonuclease subunit S [Acinetobacter sp. YH12080]
MQFEQYPSYKNSGVEWLGDVPEHWQVKPNKYVFKIQKRIAGTLGFNVLSITQKGLKIKDIESNAGQMAQDYSKYQIVNIGDFAMNHMDLLTGWIDIAKVKGVTSPDYRVFEVRNKKVNKEYFLHLFQLGYRNKILFAFGQGAAQMGRWRLQSETFNTLKMPFPSIEEQEKIVAFLDTETARIDTLIAKQEKLIELLEEQRKSIISHAVTKGLNPNAPMKDSGVEWLGDVPESWVEQKIKFISKLINEKTSEKSNVIALENIESWTGKYIETESSFESDAVKFKKNDVLFGKLRPYLAKVYLVENQGEAVGDIYVLRPNKLIHPQFLKFFMLSEKFIDYVNSSTNGTKMPRANWDFIGCISIFLPHIKVQHEIVEYLESAVLKIELIINKQISLIEKLKEYRSSVISHAVTGKIDIREFC